MKSNVDGSLVGSACPHCGFTRVRVTRETLARLLDEIRPALHSLPQDALRRKCESYAICPRCDAYALGIEKEVGYPFTDAAGRTLTIRDLEAELWTEGEVRG